jgi:glutamyl-tRNA synthetase/glutamyl-Q tRNA(Asp) synthetase
VTPSTTRFAPAPTGRLHLGHLANAVFVWGLARRFGARVQLRIEDHDRQRCRPEYESGLLDDLDRLGIAADQPSTDELRAGPSSFRQSDNGAVYVDALARLAAATDVYACDCSRSTFGAWRESHGRAWTGPGCPGGCLGRQLDRDRGDLTIRAALGDGQEAWSDLLGGGRSGTVSAEGDLPVRDRNGNWTYAFCVVVDDIRHGVSHVVRGEDLVDSTATQIRLARLLGRDVPPLFAHHPLVRLADGTKLSKSDGAMSIGERLSAGVTEEQLFGEAAFAVGLTLEPRDLSFEAATAIVAGR